MSINIDLIDCRWDKFSIELVMVRNQRKYKFISQKKGNLLENLETL